MHNSLIQEKRPEAHSTFYSTRASWTFVISITHYQSVVAQSFDRPSNCFLFWSLPIRTQFPDEIGIFEDKKNGVNEHKIGAILLTHRRPSPFSGSWQYKVDTQIFFISSKLIFLRSSYG
jgi:hypothetical protein